MEEGNRIELGFNLCVVPPHTICRYVLQFWDICQRPGSDRGQSEVGQWSNRARTEVRHKSDRYKRFGERVCWRAEVIEHSGQREYTEDMQNNAMWCNNQIDLYWRRYRAYINTGGSGNRGPDQNTGSENNGGSDVLSPFCSSPLILFWLLQYFLFLISYFLFLISYFLFLISYFLFLISYFLFLISYFLTHCSPSHSLILYTTLAPCFPNLLYLSSVSSSIQHNLIIAFLCVPYTLCPTLSVFSELLSLQLLASDLCLTSVRFPSDSSLWQPTRNYRAYLHNIQVGATHKLKPSPIPLPSSVIC